MSRVFVDRPPTDAELERLRLILSTYQDGTGMLCVEDNPRATLPGWRDFERACAIAFNGTAVESKFFVDVIFPFNRSPKQFYGINCKMRRELERADSQAVITVEVTNAAGMLWQHLSTCGINETNYPEQATLAGISLLEAISNQKVLGSSSYPEGPIVVNQSFYLVLLWSPQGPTYQLYLLPLELPYPLGMQWTCHITEKRNGTKTTRLVGESERGTLYEWYGDSGGQFKYFPHTSEALWTSPKFRLEPLSDQTETGILRKARFYFPELWSQAWD